MKFGKFYDYITPNQDWWKDILVGVVLGIGLIILKQFTGLTIGIPVLATGTEIQRFGIITFLAPFGEEIAFRGALFPALAIISPILAVLLSAGAFSMYHVTAYAGSFTAQGLSSTAGAFISAGIFGSIFAIVTLWRKSIYPAIIMHVIFNGFIALTSGALVIAL